MIKNYILILATAIVAATAFIACGDATPAKVEEALTPVPFHQVTLEDDFWLPRLINQKKTLGSIADLNRLPSALFVVDVMKEHIAVAEAVRLGIPVFAIVDTNSNPNDIDFVIPANDDASKSIDLILSTVCEAINEGIQEHKAEKVDNAEAEEVAPKRERRRVSRKEEPAAEAEAAAEATTEE